MSDQGAHVARAKDSYEAALTLDADFPTWALVPLFYSAMHYVHAACDRDNLPAEMRHPEKHNSHWVDGIRAWGTSDVVTAKYGSISRAYKSLLQGSHFARYNANVNLRSRPGRFWEEYEELKSRLGY